MTEPHKPGRRRNREDKLDWEELERAPNMAGMLSYLKPAIPVESETPEGDRLRSEALPGDTRIPGPLTGDSPGSVPPPSGSPGPAGTARALDPQVSRVIESSAADLLADPLFRETPTTAVPGVGRRRFHRCVTVEDAHTPGEQLLLEVFYRLAADPRWGRQEPNGTWLVAISMDELSRYARLHRTNIRNNLQKLRDKLALDLVALEDVREQSARTYRLFPADQILARRRAAGMEWVVKNRSVAFVSAETVAEALNRNLPGQGTVG